MDTQKWNVGTNKPTYECTPVRVGWFSEFGGGRKNSRNEGTLLLQAAGNSCSCKGPEGVLQGMHHAHEGSAKVMQIGILKGKH